MRQATRSSRMWAIAVALAALALGLWARAAPAAAIVYLYDSKSQVIGMVAPDGSAVQWEWDSNGNLLSVARRDASSLPGDVGITLVSPPAGKVNDPVQIFGKGFSPTPDQNAVIFNGVGATVSSATPTSLAVTVPDTATSGLIHVVVSGVGEANSPTNFTVLGPLTITPTTAQLLVGGTQTFTASAPSLWLVNGISGGLAEIGTVTAGITTTATYTAPTSGHPPDEVTVTAQSPDNPLNRAEAVVTFTWVPVARASRLSVTVDQPLQAAPLAASRVSLSLQPVITSVIPASVARTAGSVALTLAGQGLGNPPSGLQVLLNGSPDNDFIVSGLTGSGDGTQATATLTFPGTVTPGGRVLQITAGSPPSSSSPGGWGGNVLQITP